MEAFSSPILKQSSLFSMLGYQFSGPHLPMRPTRAAKFAARRNAYGRDYGGELVDENMIVLRKRIHEMKMAERNYEPPSDWMEWEKRYYTSYETDVCEIVGYLQTLLLNTRPSLAIGILALVTLSVPASMIMILFQLKDASTAVLSALHLN